MTTGGTSKVVERIEAAGYCRRRANPANRRSSLVELTGAGKRVLRRATAVFEDELQQRVGAVLTEPEIDQLTTTLATLRDAHRPQG